LELNQLRKVDAGEEQSNDLVIYFCNCGTTSVMRKRYGQENVCKFRHTFGECCSWGEGSYSLCVALAVNNGIQNCCWKKNIEFII